MTGVDAGHRVRASKAPLRGNRDFMLLWTGQSASVLGSQMSRLAYPLLVLTLTGSPALAGVTAAVVSVPYLLLVLPAGALVDRWDRRRVMIVCDAVRLVALASLALAGWLARIGYAHLLVVAAVSGTCAVFFVLAQRAALPSVVGADELPAAAAHNEGTIQAAILLGPPIGGLLFEIAPALPFLVDSASYLASIATLLLIRVKLCAQLEGPPPAARRRLLTEVAEGVGRLWQTPFLRAATGLTAAVGLLLPAVTLTLIVLARHHGSSAAEIGLVFGISGAGGLAGALAAPRLVARLRPGTVIIAGAWVWAGFCPLLGMVSYPLALGPIAAGLAFVIPLWNVTVQVQRIQLIPPHLLGRVTSITLLIGAAAAPLGSLLAGALLSWVGPVNTVFAVAAGMFAVALTVTVSRAFRPGLDLASATATPISSGTAA